MNDRRNGGIPEPRFPFPLSPFPFYRCHLDSGDSAGNDPLELGEVRHDVQREPMPRDPLLHVNPDARDLPAPPPGPYAGVTRVPPGGNAQAGERVDQRLLQGAEIPVEIRLVAGQVDDRVADQLTRPVEGHVAAALDLEDLDAVAVDEVVRVCVAAQRHHRGMLEQEQHVVRQAAVDPRLGEGALPLERFGVRHGAGLHDLEQTHGYDPSPMAPPPSTPAVAPAMAQRLAAVPTMALSTPQAISPGNPSRRSATAARNPTSSAPTAASTPITPLCHRFSSGRLRRQPNAPATAMPASRPASRGSPAASREWSGSSRPCSSFTTGCASVSVVPPSPAPQARAPSPIARGSLRTSVTCPRPGRANRARLGPPPRT